MEILACDNCGNNHLTQDSRSESKKAILCPKCKLLQQENRRKLERQKETIRAFVIVLVVAFFILIIAIT